MKKISPQLIIARLKKAGLRASKSSTTCVRGWHNHTSGFRVRSLGDAVSVEWVFGIMSRETEGTRRQTLEMLSSHLTEFSPKIDDRGWRITIECSPAP